MSSAVLPRLLFAGAFGALCLAAAACTSSPAGTSAGATSASVPAVGGSPGATAALGASASTSAPSVSRYENLPTGWKTFSSWDTKLVTMAGAKATVIDRLGGAEDPGDSILGRDWTAPGFRELSFSVGEDANHVPTSISCFVDGYNPGDAGVDSAIKELFRQCASADFPGADTAEAEQWTLGKLANFLQDQRKAPHVSAGGSTSEFGDGRYVMGAGYLPEYGLSVQIYIQGLEVR